MRTIQLDPDSEAFDCPGPVNEPRECERPPTSSPNQESFERVLSRKLEALRTELLSQHEQEMQQARRDLPLVALATQSGRSSLRQADDEFGSDIDHAADAERANLEQAGIATAASAMPSRVGSLGHPPPGRTLSDLASSPRALGDMSIRWRSKLEMALQCDTPGLLVPPRPSVGSGSSSHSMLSERLQKHMPVMFEGFGGLWALLRLVMLWIDLICVPVELSFEPIFPASHGVFLLFGRCFWSLDALIDAWRAQRCVECAPWKKGGADVWGSLLINVAALTLEWSMLLLEPVAWEWWLNFGKVVRLARLVCVAAQVDVLMLDAMVLAYLPTRATRMFDAAQRCFYTVAGAHWVNCLWLRGVGSWTDTTWHLATDFLDIVETLVPMLAALLLTCVIIAQTTAYFVTSEKSSTLRMRQLINKFVGRQAIPKEMATRMDHSLQLFTRGTLAQRFQDEDEMMKHFPDTLRRDLLAEVRGRILTGMLFFNDLQRCSPGSIRDVACDAVACKLVREREVVFTTRDVARHMYFVDAGNLAYARSDWTLRPLGTARPSMRAPDVGDVVTLGKKDWVCEPALWMDWQHRGECTAPRDSIILVLSAEQLSDALSESQTALSYAVRYAKRFVSIMRDRSDAEEVDDLVSFPVSISDLQWDSSSTANNHFAFISHYKEEAGTEASLMQAELLHLLQQEPSNPANDMLCPIFLDSESLFNLQTLTEHVQNSCNVILLLSPDVLRRPWCLLEIATAFNSSVPIVLVRVERPGFKFEYPDDNFYAALRQGGILSQEAEDMLSSQGVHLSDLVAILRQVFMHIAVPFSPHRTFAVRQVELADLLKRCTPC